MPFVIATEMKTPVEVCSRCNSGLHLPMLYARPMTFSPTNAISTVSATTFPLSMSALRASVTQPPSGIALTAVTISRE